MRIDELDFELPPDRIAQVPAPQRDLARLLLVDRDGGDVAHAQMCDFVAQLHPGDCVVANDTRVLRARLFGTRATGGRVEVFLVAPAATPDHWHAMLRAGGRPRVGEQIAVGDAVLVLAARDTPDGLWTVYADRPMHEVLEAHGHMPLPPYIERTRDDARAAQDQQRYQTVFARNLGAVAAPTAGLHVTPQMIEDLVARGAQWQPITLHVGLGTFAPVRTDTLESHKMHAETYEISQATADAIRSTRRAGGRIIAIGTTSVRALEASAATSPDGLPVAGTATTDLCIQPGHTFRAVDALLTNFHLPRSTLLALVAAFMGLEAMHAAYQVAIEQRYRFYSYGDAMFIRSTDTLSA